MFTVQYIIVVGGQKDDLISGAEGRDKQAEI